MAEFDLNTPAILRWVTKDVAHERRLNSVKDAVRVAMKDLTRAEFFSAKITTAEDVYAGDEIVEIFQTGRLARRGYARF